MKNTVKTTKKDKTGYKKQSNKVAASYSSLCPVWLHDKIDKSGDFAFNLNRPDFNHKLYLEKMINYSCMKWQDIVQQTHDDRKSKHHYIPIEEICPAALERLKRLSLLEYSDCIFSFAFENRLRIFGIKENEKFHVLWYDPKHEICPKKK